jgi:hypothetical protein
MLVGRGHLADFCIKLSTPIQVATCTYRPNQGEKENSSESIFGLNWIPFLLIVI